MADDAENIAEDAPKKSGKKGLMVMILGAVLAGGGGFASMYLGLLDGFLGDGHEQEVAKAVSSDLAFVPLDAIIVSLGSNASATHLKFVGHLEVPSSEKETVEALIPRVMDTLNIYLRAVDEAELEEPTAMIRLRAHMLRRIQVVLGEGLVNDLLVSEFVLN